MHMNKQKWTENEKHVVEIVNLLRNLAKFYPYKTNDELLRAYAGKLSAYSLIDIKSVCGQISENAEGRFPSLRDFKSILHGITGSSAPNREKEDLAFSRAMDMENEHHEKRKVGLRSILKQDYDSMVTSYMKKWLQVYFCDSVDLGFSDLVDSQHWQRLALEDLAEANGNVPRALEITKRKSNEIEYQRKKRVREALANRD